MSEEPLGLLHSRLVMEERLARLVASYFTGKSGTLWCEPPYGNVGCHPGKRQIPGEEPYKVHPGEEPKKETHPEEESHEERHPGGGQDIGGVKRKDKVKETSIISVYTANSVRQMLWK